MSKKLKTTIICIIIIVIISVGIIFINHNKYTDYINPFIKETVSYGIVPTDTNNYKNISVYTPKNKTKEIIHNFNGYSNDPYIKIYHKGQYVKSIEYISKQEYQKSINDNK